MSPLYLFNGKLLIKDSKLATNANCCCFTCKITKCGCDEYQYAATYSQLWIDIQNWITDENYTCNGDPVNCGAWEPKLINGVPQRDCCSQACYDIWEHILSHVGYDQETIDSKSPAELDVLCSSITVQPTFFPTDKNNPNNDLFDSISYNDRFWVTRLDVSYKAGQLGDPCLPDPGETLCQNTFFTQSLAPVTFATLVGNDSLTADIDSNALDLLKTGSCLPHEKTTNYTNVNDCRNCYGALYKLGTYDQFGRYDPIVVYDCGTEQESPFIEASLISNDTNTTTFEFKVIDQLFYPCLFNPLCCCFDEAVFVGNVGCKLGSEHPVPTTQDIPSETYTRFGDNDQNSPNKATILFKTGDIPILLKYVGLPIFKTNSTPNRKAKISIYSSTATNPPEPLDILVSVDVDLFNVENFDHPYVINFNLLNHLQLDKNTTYWLVVETVNCPFNWYHTTGLHLYANNIQNQSKTFGETFAIYYPPPNPIDAVPPNPPMPKQLAYYLGGTFKIPKPTKLTISDCMSKKFPDANPINPYGILTDQLSGFNGNTLINTETLNQNGDTASYFEFDLSYKYEISWDNTNWYAATNKWTVKYGPQPSNNPSFSFVGDVNNYYQNNIPQPISASISSLDFDPVTISTKMSVNWGGDGILIGNSSCSFSDSKLSKIDETRSIPSLTVSSENPGTDCIFTPVLQQLSEPNGAPYWTISSVGLVCNDANYTIGESLKVTIGNGDIEEIKAELKINSGSRTSPTLTISGGGGNGATFTPTLSSTGSPTVWSLSGGSASGGSGYVTGTSLTITTNPEDVTIIPAKATVLARGEPSITASAPNGNGAVLSVQLSQAGSPPVWSVSKVNVTNGGSNYINNSNIEFTTVDNIVTNASARLLTTSLSPVLSIGEYVVAGNGAQFQINISGPYQYSGNCSFPDYYEIDIIIVNGGNGYDPNTDSFTLVLDPDTTVAFSSINSGIELPIAYSVDSNGTIISIDGLLDPDSLEFSPLYLFLFWKPSGIIKCIKVINGGKYYSDTGAAYGISVVDGGQYYKPGTPVVEVINGGKYYHLEAPYVRAVSGPCINNIKMDIWHPGPCGISSELITETSMNTSWEGINGSDGRIDGIVFSSLSANFTEDLTDKYLLISDGSKYLKYKIEEYVNSTSLEIAPILNGDPLMNQTEDREYHIDGTYYADLIENVYRKFWLYYSDKNNPRSFDNYICPCCGPVDLILGVVKLEGCENFTIDKNYDIPLTQWEIDFNYCDILTRSNIYVRTCNNNNYRYNCCLPIDNCGDNPTDYRNNGYPCVYNNSDNCPPRIEIASQGGLFNLQNIAITCENMPSNYWDNCAVITKENAPWKKTDINCP